jgi:hypothetical protein
MYGDGLGARDLPGRWETKLAAYRYAARITEEPWDYDQVKACMGPILDWLTGNREETRQHFELKCAILEELTTNFGLHPHAHPALPRKGRVVPGNDRSPEMPSAGKVFRLAQRMYTWVRDDR